jgi:hypothetical protein
MLTQRELATVLAGLRALQRSTGDVTRSAEYRRRFAGVRPLDNAEIDALCDRLNLAQVTDLRLLR